MHRIEWNLSKESEVMFHRNEMIILYGERDTKLLALILNHKKTKPVHYINFDR